MITELSDTILKEFKSKFSDQRYTHPKTLDLHWVTSFDFQASAGVNSSNQNQHLITIFYGAAISIYKDAVLFPQMCSQHFVSEKYQDLFELLRYDSETKTVLPADLSNEDAKLEFFTSSLGWLYLHEQAHLFQDHGTLLSSELGQQAASRTFVWQEFFSNDEAPITGKEAWIRHSCELAADFEATNLILQFMLVKDNQKLKVSSLWLLVTGLTCMFHRFYGKNRASHGGEAIGTHPDPAYRMRYTFSCITTTLTHPKVRQYAPWATAETLSKIMMHAFHTANMYMQIAHFEQDGLPQFIVRTIDESDEDKRYLGGIMKTWNSLYPKVIQRYFGWGEGSVMSFIED